MGWDVEKRFDGISPNLHMLKDSFEVDVRPGKWAVPVIKEVVGIDPKGWTGVSLKLIVSRRFRLACRFRHFLDFCRFDTSWF